MHSLPSRLHSLVYLREFRAPDEEGGRGTCGKAKRTNGSWKGRGGGTSEDPRRPAAVRRLLSAAFQVPVPRSRTAHIVSSVYEARFKPFTLAFTLSRLRSLRMPLAAFLATTPRRPPPPRHAGDQRASPRVKGRIPVLSSSPVPRKSHRALSLNPRYPRADHLGNLSSRVDDIADARAGLGA